MKYIYVKKKDGTLKYQQLKEKPLLTIHILNIEVQDSFEFPEGEDIVFKLKERLIQKELESKEVIMSLDSGEFIANISKEECIVLKHNEEIIKHLQELDKIVPRATEDIINILSKDNIFDNILKECILAKVDLRKQLK